MALHDNLYRRHMQFLSIRDVTVIKCRSMAKTLRRDRFRVQQVIAIVEQTVKLLHTYMQAERAVCRHLLRVAVENAASGAVSTATTASSATANIRTVRLRNLPGYQAAMHRACVQIDRSLPGTGVDRFDRKLIEQLHAVWRHLHDEAARSAISLKPHERSVYNDMKLPNVFPVRTILQPTKQFVRSYVQHTLRQQWGDANTSSIVPTHDQSSPPSIVFPVAAKPLSSIIDLDEDELAQFEQRQRDLHNHHHHHQHQHQHPQQHTQHRRQPISNTDAVVDGVDGANDKDNTTRFTASWRAEYDRFSSLLQFLLLLNSHFTLLLHHCEQITARLTLPGGTASAAGKPALDVLPKHLWFRNPDDSSPLAVIFRQLPVPEDSLKDAAKAITTVTTTTTTATDSASGAVATNDVTHVVASADTSNRRDSVSSCSLSSAHSNAAETATLLSLARKPHTDDEEAGFVRDADDNRDDDDDDEPDDGVCGGPGDDDDGSAADDDNDDDNDAVTAATDMGENSKVKRSRRTSDSESNEESTDERKNTDEVDQGDDNANEDDDDDEEEEEEEEEAAGDEDFEARGIDNNDRVGDAMAVDHEIQPMANDAPIHGIYDNNDREKVCDYGDMYEHNDCDEKELVGSRIVNTNTPATPVSSSTILLVSSSVKVTTTNTTTTATTPLTATTTATATFPVMSPQLMLLLQVKPTTPSDNLDNTISTTAATAAPLPPLTPPPPPPPPPPPSAASSGSTSSFAGIDPNYQLLETRIMRQLSMLRLLNESSHANMGQWPDALASWDRLSSRRNEQYTRLERVALTAYFRQLSTSRQLGILAAVHDTRFL